MKINFDRIYDTDRMVIFTDKAPVNIRGKKLPIVSGGLFIRYDDKFNMDDGTYCSSSDNEYESFDGLTLNELRAQGFIEDWYPYKKFDIDNILPPICSLSLTATDEDDEEVYNRVLGNLDINGLIVKIQQQFKENGYDVTLAAIKHQFEMWSCDCKSGYRDDERGYHLFTPCGHNPFSIRLTTLHKLCDWQITYGI